MGASKVSNILNGNLHRSCNMPTGSPWCWEHQGFVPNLPLPCVPLEAAFSPRCIHIVSCCWTGLFLSVRLQNLTSSQLCGLKILKGLLSSLHNLLQCTKTQEKTLIGLDKSCAHLLEQSMCSGDWALIIGQARVTCTLWLPKQQDKVISDCLDWKKTGPKSPKG